MEITINTSFACHLHSTPPSFVQPFRLSPAGGDDSSARQVKKRAAEDGVKPPSINRRTAQVGPLAPVRLAPGMPSIANGPQNMKNTKPNVRAKNNPASLIGFVIWFTVSTSLPFYRTRKLL